MNEQQHLDSLHDIKRIMERSTRFMSLSGLGGVGAGVSALIGAFFAWKLIFQQNFANSMRWDRSAPYDPAPDDSLLTLQLLLIALAVLVAALGTGFYFTWRKAQAQGLSVWDASARKVIFNLAIPLFAGGFFILGLLYNGYAGLAAPACLVFYGLGLVNASKYTVTDIRYLGYIEVLIGVIALFNLYNGLFFWALGFGVMHIFYGALMWWKYERKPAA
ncbi:hypothetical protein ACFOTA_10385 [Chitinophaga sp. GCM10012297]|uniref:Uncharacterized protein n=1 Tax=Chitinophaga chungangae TaxID=2821488 RepID=A0ABS3YD76_9BACT|nr:hypothetical protein [Chitinophaga chungangae]MBO9152614.1 hypothetical protein [Chitinophaga chungangae]